MFIFTLVAYCEKYCSQLEQKCPAGPPIQALDMIRDLGLITFVSNIQKPIFNSCYKKDYFDLQAYDNIIYLTVLGKLRNIRGHFYQLLYNRRQRIGWKI